jgi:ribosome-binding factor A
MSTRRTAKVAQALRQVVSTAVLTEIRDPRVKNVTVLSVEVAEDLRSARVNVSVMGDPGEQALCMQGLRSARGFLQGRIAALLDLRYTPVLDFRLDQGVKKSIAASQLLRQLEKEERSHLETQPVAAGSDEGREHADASDIRPDEAAR